MSDASDPRPVMAPTMPGIVPPIEPPIISTTQPAAPPEPRSSRPPNVAPRRRSRDPNALGPYAAAVVRQSSRQPSSSARGTSSCPRLSLSSAEE